MSMLMNKGLLAGAAMMFGLAVLADEPVKKADPAPEKVLAKQEGSWDAEMTIWGPGMEEKGMTAKATETNTMLAGKWLISDFKTEFAGQEFRGHGQFGFDSKKGKYVGTWLDSMSTKISPMEGTYDAAANTLTWLSETDDPHSGKPMKAKMVVSFSNNSYAMTEFVKPEGTSDFTKMMQITYKRASK